MPPISSFQLELSRVLFPEELINQIARDQTGQFVLLISAATESKVSLRVRAPVGHSPEQANSNFLEILSGAAMDYWGSRATPIATAEKLGPPAVGMDMAFRFTSYADGTARIRIITDPSLHSAVRVLRALAPMRQRLRIIVESTNPVDRFVVALNMSDQETVKKVVLKLVNDQMFRSKSDHEFSKRTDFIITDQN